MSARSQLRAHFLKNIGRVINADELRQVAGGISELARLIQAIQAGGRAFISATWLTSRMEGRTPKKTLEQYARSATKAQRM